MSVLTRVGVIAGAFALTAAGVAPAHAAKYVHDDAAADQTRTTCTDPANPATCTDAVDPAVANGDITRVAVRHAARKVFVNTTYTDVSTSADESMQLVQVVTNSGMRRLAAIYTPANSEDASVVLIRPNGKLVRCRNMGAVRDTTANVMQVVIPRSCLGSPRWVKVGVGHAAAPDFDGEVGVGDDALVSGALSDDIALSPRIRRA